jgi:hypothetical protein
MLMLTPSKKEEKQGRDSCGECFNGPYFLDSHLTSALDQKVLVESLRGIYIPDRQNNVQATWTDLPQV